MYTNEKLTSLKTVVVKSFSCINDSVFGDTLTAFCCVFGVFFFIFLPHSLFIYLFFYPLNYFLEVYFLSSIIIHTIYLLLPPVFFASFLMYLLFLYYFFSLFFLLYLVVSFSAYFVLHFFKTVYVLFSSG